MTFSFSNLPFFTCDILLITTYRQQLISTTGHFLEMSHFGFLTHLNFGSFQIQMPEPKPIPMTLDSGWMQNQIRPRFWLCFEEGGNFAVATNGGSFVKLAVIDHHTAAIRASPQHFGT